MIGKKNAALVTVNLTAEMHNCNYLQGPLQWMQHLKTARFKDVSLHVNLNQLDWWWVMGWMSFVLLPSILNKYFKTSPHADVPSASAQWSQKY